MTRYFYSLLAISMLTSCSTKPVDSQQKEPSVPREERRVTKPGLLQDTLYVKKWLTGVIEAYPNSTDLNAGYSKMRSSLTDNYYNYKQDAMNLEYEPPGGSMTKEEFHKKWSGKFNTKFVGIGGFIISSQDNGLVKVKTCRMLQNSDSVAVYAVVIEDLDFKTKFTRDFKLIVLNNTLLIDDILEHD